MTYNDRLIGSLPYESGQLHMAKLLAYAIPFTLISWIPSLLFVIRLVSEGIAVSDHWLGIFVHLSSCVPFWFMIALGYLIAHISKQRWSYLIGIVALRQGTLEDYYFSIQSSANW